MNLIFSSFNFYIIHKNHGLKFKIYYLGMFKELFYKYLLIFKPKKTENIPTKMLENKYINKYVS